MLNRSAARRDVALTVPFSIRLPPAPLPWRPEKSVSMSSWWARTQIIWIDVLRPRCRRHWRASSLSVVPLPRWKIFQPQIRWS